MHRPTRTQHVELVAITLQAAAIATQNAGHDAIAHTLDTIALTLKVYLADVSTPHREFFRDADPYHGIEGAHLYRLHAPVITLSDNVITLAAAAPVHRPTWQKGRPASNEYRV